MHRLGLACRQHQRFVEPELAQAGMRDCWKRRRDRRTAIERDRLGTRRRAGGLIEQSIAALGLGDHRDADRKAIRDAMRKVEQQPGRSAPQLQLDLAQRRDAAAGADRAFVDRPFDLAAVAIDQPVGAVEIADDLRCQPIDPDRAQRRAERAARRVEHRPVARHRARPFGAGEQPGGLVLRGLDRLNPRLALLPDPQRAARVAHVAAGGVEIGGDEMVGRAARAEQVDQIEPAAIAGIELQLELHFKRTGHRRLLGIDRTIDPIE